jgi:hypothetical protein
MKNILFDNSPPIALIFFARPDLLKITFQEVRKAKPKKLFLIQDGARINNLSDENNIKKCREIVSNVDWECEVLTNYSFKNLGCGMRVFSGLNWAFEYVDRLLILEDDCVPSQDLFPFTSELLERYKDDERLGLICGMNNLGVYEKAPNDYFFTTSGSIWGWATWKRVWDDVDYNLLFLEDNYATKIVYNTDSKLESMAEYLKGNLEKGEPLTSWSFQLGMNLLMNSKLNIVPKYNMISNIGLSNDGANSVSSIKFVPRGLRRIYFMKTYTLDFPLKHPRYMVNDLEFKKKLDRLMGDGYPLVKFYRLLESITYRIIRGDFKSILKGFKRRFLK